MAQIPLIFDLDGTLLDTSTRHFTVYETVTKQFNGTVLDKAAYWQQKRRNTPWPEILTASGIDPGQSQAFLTKFIALIEQIDMLKLDELFPFSLPCLERLSAYELYLVSLRRNEANLLQQIEWLGLAPHFARVITGHTENEGFEMKKELIGRLNEKNAVVIGDTEADIKAARLLGLRSIAVTSGIRDNGLLEQASPDRLVESVKAIDESLIQSLIQAEE